MLSRGFKATNNTKTKPKNPLHSAPAPQQGHNLSQSRSSCVCFAQNHLDRFQLSALTAPWHIHHVALIQAEAPFPPWCPNPADSSGAGLFAAPLGHHHPLQCTWGCHHVPFASPHHMLNLEAEHNHLSSCF